MKPFNQAKMIATAALVLLSSPVVVANGASVPADSWSPYTFGDSSYAELFDYYSSSKVIPLYADSDSGTFGGKDNEEKLSVGFSDSIDGFWKVSLDLNQSKESAFADEQYRLNTAYSPNNGESTFYIDYGNRRVPVSIKVDDILEYNQKRISDENFSLGLNQKLNDSWSVSISYTKSELEQNSSQNSEVGYEHSGALNQHYWFDLNKDGLPESVNLFSELGTASDFDKASEGIEIRLTRQASDKLRVGGTISSSNLNLDWQPYKFDNIQLPISEYDEQSFSLFGQYDISQDWRFNANLSRNYFQKESPQVVSLLAADASELNFENTTLDIGVQYQGRWDDMGLVIRIDLLNLLGEAADQDNGLQQLDDSGLMPYTFQSPKYIKLSGSINF
ncbi:TonB-dependent receptor [Kangiella sediminilitoris]|uniref:TonB-dependent receptor-like beta-barrel domain-containing protein n=1 Tax=Kangiella sediminilitoris TaxID=1144748 RepID=A0A1B3B984_9GAMM|nr:hypothetical protein [Kangiella sediminilitoris]AOE49353.1 hypothetical protein KS2013_629 [Kangiella sediminilitoris]